MTVAIIRLQCVASQIPQMALFHWNWTKITFLIKPAFSLLLWNLTCKFEIASNLTRGKFELYVFSFILYSNVSFMLVGVLARHVQIIFVRNQLQRFLDYCVHANVSTCLAMGSIW